MISKSPRLAGMSARNTPLALGLIALVFAFLSLTSLLSGCAGEIGGDPNLSRNVYVELVDWHIAGLWVINCPVAWFRVANYNNVPVKDIKLKYATYDFDGKLLNQGDYTIDGTVPPGTVRNFIEQYLGLVEVQTDKMMVRFVSVKRAQ